MMNTLNLRKYIIIFGLPLFIISTMVFLSKSALFDNNSDKLSLAISVDLLLTTPLIYFLLIRKTTIPKTTIIPFIILGVIICSYIIPTEQQLYLNLFKTWVLPIIELSIVSFVVYNILKARKRFKHNKDLVSYDFFTALKTTCNEFLPKLAVTPVVTEIAVVYYGFINWKKRPLKSNEFSYHKDSGSIGLLFAFIFLIAIETVAFHLLLSRWNTVVAWIVTGISIYSGIQVFGFVKSMYKRPILIKDNMLYLRYGIMTESIINIQDIESIELSTKDIELNKTTRKLSFLGHLEGHNLVIKLKTNQTLIGLYGIKRSYNTLALHVDKKIEFKNRIDKILSTTNL